MKLLSLPLLRFLAVIPVLFVVFVFSVPSIVQADPPTAREPAPVNLDKVTLQNPLKDISTIDGLLVAILNIIMVLMVPVIVFFIIYAGFKYVMAQGNASQVEEATRALTYAIIGGVLILAAVAISQIIQSVVTSFSV